MSKILYEVYKNDIKDSESAMFGKYYARLKNIETMNISKMAKHISEHGSVFTEDVVEGVMKKFKSCLIEMLLESKKVKVNGLGTFYLTCECQKGGADKEEDFNVKENLKALHIRFLPDQTAEENLSSREFIKKAEFYNIKNLLNTGSGDAITPIDGDDSGDTDGKTDGNENENQGGANENQNQGGSNPEPGDIGGNGGGGTEDGTDES